MQLRSNKVCHFTLLGCVSCDHIRLNCHASFIGMKLGMKVLIYLLHITQSRFHTFQESERKKSDFTSLRGPEADN